MKILAFDTATSACSVALLANGEIRKRFQIAPQQHAELILPMINDLLVEAGFTLQQLNAIAVGCGPGSFMGVRIAAGVAQGLAFGADLPVIQVSSLQALAQSAYQKTGIPDVLTAWDARMHAVYWGAYHLGPENILLPIQPDALSAPDDVSLPAEKPWCAAGNGWQVYRQQLLPVLTSCQEIITDIYPQASSIARIAEIFYAQGKFSSALEVEPKYLRDQVAHIKD